MLRWLRKAFPNTLSDEYEEWYQRKGSLSLAEAGSPIHQRLAKLIGVSLL